MPSCEKCWADSAHDRMLGRDDSYRSLMAAREAAGTICTAEEQAGVDAGLCKFCDRRTVHQHAKVCMACGFDDKAETFPGRPDCPATVDPEEIPL